MSILKNKSVLAIIPARAGSKRLPGKNMMNLCGKPLIQWTIEAARGSEYIDEILISTDSENIIELAKNLGVNAPFKRPSELAQDKSSTLEAVRHAVDFQQEVKGLTYDYVLLLQPTSPLRTTEDIDEALRLLERKNADAVISVCAAEHSPLWSNTLDDTLSMDNFVSNEIKSRRSQELPTYYRLNGAIYICKLERLITENSFFIKNNIYAHIMKQENSVDIDTLIDFKLAEAVLKSADV